MTELKRAASVWLLQDGEPLPIDDQPRLMRTGDQARQLVDAGYAVTWWTSRFSHNLKRFRTHPDLWCELGPRYRIALLDGPGYARNISLQRIRHYRAIAAQFSKLAAHLPAPDLILGSYPSPELCEAGRRYAREHQVPFVVDIRDPWPDVFVDFAPGGQQWKLLPVLWYYRRKIRAIARDASSIVAVSNAMLEWGLRYSGRAKTELDRVFHIGFRPQLQSRTIAVPPRFTKEQPLICLFATTCGASYYGELLIDAARILERAGEHRVRFVVTGDGDMRSQWIERAKGLASVSFTGWLPDSELQEHFRSAHLGLVLLKGNTRFWLGNKIFEYLSAFLGVVNNVPGEPADIVATRDLGISVAPRNPSELADALCRLADDPARVRRCMENAKTAFERQFDRETISANYLDHLSNLMRKDMRQGEGVPQ